ncbi:hypothetical protein GPECTOR_8g195 [Gonium pectorale]|uniref:Uncharacterized protein n=1 Tax=Gonium pectorale TaxID=33097 RepID=A0A150GSF4_GONPE|nr:hypothetical protein GPECTOR_8g195 [Gonium pectorale]|eukprot:KXZ52809.1 hypothetical protein GPECTOR_8g195 [Gonium pectorale]
MEIFVGCLAFEGIPGPLGGNVGSPRNCKASPNPAVNCVQEPIPILADGDDGSDLRSAIVKLNSGGILHTEKRALERLLAQRYEDALAAAATAEQEEPEPLGGGSDVLRQVLLVFRQHSLPTELDRSAEQEPAEWRVRNYRARRRAFLVVRSMVRLKREVKRLGMPITDLGWLLPVAAQERWGELKALAANYKRLEAELQDAEFAIAQLTELKESQPKSLPLPKTGGPPVRASPQRGARNAAGRVSGTGGRAVSESVRQTFVKDGHEPPKESGSSASLPPVALSRAAQVLDLVTCPLPGDQHDGPDIYHLAAQSVEPQARKIFQVPTETVPNTGPGGRANRNWGVCTDPSPPTIPLPGSRRPLGHLSLSSPSPLTGLPGQLPAIGNLANGAGETAAADAPPLPVLMEEGETAEQALARWSVTADDTRGALVDTSRKFRQVVDLCNSSWPDQRWWLASHTHEDAATDAWLTSDAFVVNRAEMVRCLKAGIVAFQFVCYSDELLVGPSGNSFDWWTSDPWEVAADLVPDKIADLQHARAAHPHKAGEHERLVGMPMGVRVLQQLANSVAEAAGPQALDCLPIILHISERQQESIAADLLQYNVYRRLRRNLYLVVQKSQPVMRYSAEHNAFVPAINQPWYTPGTGFSMLQLLWPGQALHLNDSGELERLPHSLMQELQRRNTEWFVSRNGQDLSMLMDDGALDMRSLSHVSYLWNTPHLRYSLAVETASSVARHRDMIAYHGSVLLCRKPKVAGMVVGRLDGAVRVDRYGGGSKPQLPVVELMACELNSAHMQHELTQIGATRAATATVGLGRYVFRFEILAKVLTGPTVLRPKLYSEVDRKAVQASQQLQPRRPPTPPLEPPPVAAANNADVPVGAAGVMLPFLPPGGLSESHLAHAASQGMDTVLLKLHLSMMDLTVHHASKVVALKAHRMPIYVRGAQDGHRLVEVLFRSDQDLREAGQRLAAKLPSFSRQQKPGQSICVFVQDNSVSLTATNVAAGLVRRERNDRIHLVTVVATDAQRGEGTALLDRLLKAFRTHTDVTAHVLSQEGRGVLECVAEVVTTHKCGLLIAGSAGITAVASTPPRGGALQLPLPGLKPPGANSNGAAGGRAPAAGTAIGGLDEAGTEMVLSSVALSVLRTFSLPVILVTTNTRNFKRNATDGTPNGTKPAAGRPPAGNASSANSGRLAAMAVVERHSRPMMHHLTRCLLEPSLRQDTLAMVQVLPQGLAQGNAGYDPSSIQAVALKTIMTNFESIASANDFHTAHKVYVQGEWQNAICAAARDSGAQLLSVQLAPGSTRSLPLPLLQLVRSAPCPVLIYPERLIVPGSEVLAADEAEG